MYDICTKILWSLLVMLLMYCHCYCITGALSVTDNDEVSYTVTMVDVRRCTRPPRLLDQQHIIGCPMPPRSPDQTHPIQCTDMSTQLQSLDPVPCASIGQYCHQYCTEGMFGGKNVC